MKTLLQLLIVEDNPDDMELLLHELRHAGFDPQWTRVQTGPDFQEALKKQPDIILSDFAMPQFDGLQALELLRESGLDIPFILISGTVGEDIAVEAMKRGATDYLLKDRVGRLGNAIERALEQKRLRAERKQTEAELRWKTTLLEAQLDSSIDGILVVDNRGKKISQNRRMAELWKIPPHIAADKDDAAQLVFATNQTKNPQQFLERVSHLYAHPDKSSHDELELLDGTILDRYSAPVRDRNGTNHGRIWYFRDITERRKLEQQFHQSQKMESIGQLAGGIAHDFNNILTAIIGNIELVKMETGNNPLIVECLDDMQKATRRATDLVNQILAFSRQSKHERGPVKLNHVVLEALKLLRASVPATIRIQTDLAETPTVLANSTAIHQVLMNLGTNAWHAMRNQPGTMKIEMGLMEADEDFVKIHPDLRPGRYVRLSVSDTGCGMEPATLERIFEPFFTTKPVGEGTGLGLAVVHGIMKSHQGAISIYSHLGEGSTFHLYFPVFETEAVTHEIKSTPLPRGNGEHILFVDDEVTLARLGKTMLERLGYHVTMKTSALEALALVREHPGQFDLVVTDLTMPVMDGLTLGGQLRQIRADLPIILTTGYCGVMTAEKACALGFRELLGKPSTARTLGEAIHRVLQEKVSA